MVARAAATLTPAPALATIPAMRPEPVIPDYVPDDLEPGDGTSFPWS
jgi:hypothetical protein